MRHPIIEVQRLRKTFGAAGKIEAVAGLSFEIAEGEIFGMLGPNGAGKTTTMEILEGLQEADSGEIRYRGGERPPDWKERIGVQMQATSLFEQLTVAETLELFAGLYAHHLPIAEIFERIALTEKKDQRVQTLSGGQKQRLVLGLAIVHDPEILFLDEPTTGLDPQARHNIWEMIRHLKVAGKTLMLTTHMMEEAQRLCDRVAIIDHGRLLALDTPHALVAALRGQSRISFSTPAGIDPNVWREFGDTIQPVDARGLTIIYTEDAGTTLRSVLDFAEQRGIAIEHLAIDRPDLEDVFLHFTGRRLRD
ncbi:MAG: ABC transporter ATP-binding protein [Deltaproteobacteria bacterium]|nr:MAG: ABC transporter ATP-binding protein [Deltaproteobacteria bacterium]